MVRWGHVACLGLASCSGVGPVAMSGAPETETDDATTVTAGPTASATSGVDDTDTNASADGTGAVPTTATGTVDDTTSTTTSDAESSTGATMLPRDCAEVLADDPRARSGVYDVDPPEVGPIQVYCDMETDGGGWTRFWWWTPGRWPAGTTDVLADPFGACDATGPYCFGRLPAYLSEDDVSLLAIDPQAPTKYRWDFDPDNDTAHAAWQAFAEHTVIDNGVARDGDPWMPMALEGSSPPAATQDSFMYRTEHGVASVLMDDDNCDCYTSLQMGHGMCYAGWGTGSSPENSFGVDRLYDPDAEDGPRPEYHLELLYR